jgi:mRNA interferase RelE/StbE
VARYELLIKPSARKELAGIGSRKDRERLTGIILRLADEPRPAGSQKLAGADQLFRIRSGDFRVLYEIDDGRVVVMVIRIAHRRDAYRRLA